ncbi:MAG TPA: HupE/UreJ family protein [Gemmatimonadaceae bacterium]|nr:HupE/UreJ family protein [Gemmatimonadaceae bacterium]
MMHQRREPITERWTTRCRRVALRSLTALCALLATSGALRAHEIPQRVAVRGFVQQDGTRLQVLLRVPLEAMRDVEFPLRDDGSLDLVRVRALLADAARLWIVNGIEVTADGRELSVPRLIGARVALPNDRAFTSLASARAAFTAAPIDSAIVQWKQVLFDVALEYTLPSADARPVLHPRLAHLGFRTTSVLHVVDADGRDRTLTYDGNPDAIALDPAWHQTASHFVASGFTHILGGLDHLLFVLCLVLPVRRWQSLVRVVTAFTVAHSLTLGAAALGYVPHALWFPPLVEMLIAGSIVWLAIENVLLTEERLSARWPVAFVFGLVHGFGFSFALGSTLQFAGANLVSALLAFNVGVEAGQLAVLSAMVPVLWLVRLHAGAGRDRLVTIIGSVLIAHTAWHWSAERAAALSEHRAGFRWPTLDAAFALSVVQGALLAALAMAVALAMRQILRVPRQS